MHKFELYIFFNKYLFEENETSFETFYVLNWIQLVNLFLYYTLDTNNQNNIKNILTSPTFKIKPY